jgi:hypothetical protein
MANTMGMGEGLGSCDICRRASVLTEDGDGNLLCATCATDEDYCCAVCGGELECTTLIGGKDCRTCHPFAFQAPARLPEERPTVIDALRALPAVAMVRADRALRDGATLEQALAASVTLARAGVRRFRPANRERGVR